MAFNDEADLERTKVIDDFVKMWLVPFILCLQQCNGCDKMQFKFVNMLLKHLRDKTTFKNVTSSAAALNNIVFSILFCVETSENFPKNSRQFFLGVVGTSQKLLLRWKLVTTRRLRG